MLSFGRYLIKRTTARRFHNNTSGTAAVEFVFVFPVFFLLLAIACETGVMMFTEYVLQGSLQEAARLVRTGQAQEKKMTAADFKKAVCRIARVVIACESKVEVYMRSAADFTTLAAGGNTSVMSIGSQPGGLSSFDCGQREQAVALIAAYDYDFSIPYVMKFFGNKNNNKTRRLAAFAVFKNEPFPAVTANKCQ